MDKQIHRIASMEDKFDKAKEYIKRLNEDFDILDELVDELRTYYQSAEWLDDYHTDEEGLLPIDLKCGVLSEDGIDGLLSEYNDLLQNIKNIKGE